VGGGGGGGGFAQQHQEVARVEALNIPDSAPEWSPAELERYLHVVAMVGLCKFNLVDP
jgi:hypothetical protein